MKCDRKIRKRKRLQKKRGRGGDGGGVAGLQKETQRLQTSGGPAAPAVRTLHAEGSFFHTTFHKRVQCVKL